MAVVQESVALYWQRALACSAQLAFVLDDSQRLVAMSAGMAAALGATTDELVGRTCASFMHGAEGAPAACPLHDLLLDEVQHEGEVYSTALGKRMLVTVTPLANERGRLTHVLHVAVDLEARTQAEEALRESEARYRSLFEHSPVAMWEEDDSQLKAHLDQLAAQGIDDVIGYLTADPVEYAHCLELIHVIDVNQAAVELFGAASREELLARVGDLSAGQAGRGVHRFWAALLAGERSATFEEVNISLDGRELHVLETRTVVPGQEGSCERVYVADVDITERKRAERALQLSQARYARAERVGHIGTWEYDLATERFWASPETRQLLGLGPSDGTLSVAEVTAALADPAALMEAFRALLEEGKEADLEYEIVPDGSSEPRVAWSVATVERAEDGTPASVIGVVQDVTARKHAERALLDAEARYRAMFEENRAVKLLIDPQTGAIVDASPSAADFYGYSREALKTMAISDINLAPSDDVIEAMHGIERGEVGEFLFRHRLAGGEVRDVEVSSGPIEVQGRSLLFSIVQDVTERRRTELALREREAQLEQAQRIAHVGHYVLDIAAGTWTSSAGFDEIVGIDAGYTRNREGWFGLIHPAERGGAARYFQKRVMEKRRPYDRELRIVRPADGQERWVHCLGSLEEGRAGELPRMFGVLQDVTARHRDREELRRSAERLRQTVDGTIQAMGQLVESRDPYTAGHERRVAYLSCAIADKLGWGEAEVDELCTAALVHDIGKIAVPSEILSRPGRLSDMEFALVKGHPWAAHEILAPIAFTSQVADIVLQHHERLDGSGYPRGLRDGEILPAARVLAVADVVEAMTTHRPYRPALPVAEAVAEIKAGLGERYDREAGLACLQLLNEGFSLEGNI